MSDASVLTKMRVGIKKLKEETISMNLQLGIGEIVRGAHSTRPCLKLATLVAAETVIATKRIISEDSVG